MFQLENIPQLLDILFLGQSLGVWFSFLAIVSALLALDLGILNRGDVVVSPRVSLLYTSFYVMAACMFGVWLWGHMGKSDGIDYFTAYMIELSLSLDNLFIMSLILGYFSIPRKYQHRILFWGVVGVLVMRGIMIASGIAIVEHFHWVLYVFAAFLIFTGVKMMLSKDEDENLDDSALIKFFQKRLRFTKEIDGHRFLTRLPHPKNPDRMVLYVTPLFMALICIEFMDLVFALDSVPAVFAITTEPFVVYSSNIFAILGLRSMYFAVIAMLDRFKYMGYALSIILIFIGFKVFYNGFFGHIEPLVSLSITLAVLAGGFAFSLIKTKTEN